MFSGPALGCLGYILVVFNPPPFGGLRNRSPLKKRFLQSSCQPRMQLPCNDTLRPLVLVSKRWLDSALVHWLSARIPFPAERLLAIGARDAGNDNWNDPKKNHPTGGFLYSETSPVHSISHSLPISQRWQKFRWEQKVSAVPSPGAVGHGGLTGEGGLLSVIGQGFFFLKVGRGWLVGHRTCGILPPCPCQMDMDCEC